MPNWCENDLVIEGKAETINLLIKLAKGKDSDFDFNQFLPYPLCYQNKEVEKKCETDGYNGYRYSKKDAIMSGYSWCNLNWGTKWNLCKDSIYYNRVEEMKKGYKRWCLGFDTAWSPPTELIKALSKIFPCNITLKYKEEGCCFKGILKIKKGEVSKEETYDIK